MNEASRQIHQEAPIQRGIIISPKGRGMESLGQEGSTGATNEAAKRESLDKEGSRRQQTMMAMQYLRFLAIQSNCLIIINERGEGQASYVARECSQENRANLAYPKGKGPMSL
ncbi:conserved hypothetical protein [Ricinus communis]|uniref:Uncharacterized protein n=1 Tax=Ricinus communis TaxID=3988 RepID=B9T8E4_RICCO|nr:conserved hypothetical protein [Ricinus communis]